MAIGNLCTTHVIHVLQARKIFELQPSLQTSSSQILLAYRNGMLVFAFLFMT